VQLDKSRCKGKKKTLSCFLIFADISFYLAKNAYFWRKIKIVGKIVVFNYVVD